MKTEEEMEMGDLSNFYKAVSQDTPDTVGGRLLRGYCERMAEAHSDPTHEKRDYERRTRLTAIRTEYRAKAKAASTQTEVVQFAPDVNVNCFIFADGSRIRADAFK